MVKIQNKRTNETIYVQGCWSCNDGLAFLSNQSHPITDCDSPVKWQHEKTIYNSWDEESQESYDVYVVPEDWKIVDLKSAEEKNCMNCMYGFKASRRGIWLCAKSPKGVVLCTQSDLREGCSDFIKGS